MGTYTWQSPGGVPVESCVPPVEDRWWDNPLLHLPWSYLSWASLILLGYGRPALRAWGKRKNLW